MMYNQKVTKTLFFLVFTLCFHSVFAQQNITLQQCYEWSEENYPLIKQKDLIRRSGNLNISNLEKAILPQISFNGQASIQSEVPSFKIPGVNFNGPTKDQYKIYAEINQPLTELYTIKTNKEIQQRQTAVQEQSLQSELYKVHDRINQIYFGILLTQKQIDLNELSRKDIETGINKVTAAIKNGIDYKSSLDKLKAELIRNQQRNIELDAQRRAFIDMLSYFTNKSMDENTTLQEPDAPNLADSIIRPEIKTFELKNKMYGIQEKLIQNKNIPRISIFMQGGAGQPSPLNFISGTMRPFFISGLKLNWSLNSFFTQKNEKSLISIDKKYNELQKELFIFNTRLQIKQQNSELTKLNKLIQTDDDLVALRNSIKTTSQVQLENGIITSNDYIKEVNAEDQARQNKALHEVQLLIASYNLQFSIGN